MQGPVEVDETYIGGVGTQVRGRGAERKVIVAIAAEIRGKGPGRIRMAVVPDVSAESLHGFILDNVQIGSEVRTDGWSGYNGLDSRGYRHKAVNISASGDPAHVSSCQEFIGWLLSSVACGLEFIKARYGHHIWHITLMNTHFDSIAESQRPVVCYSID